MMATRFGFPAFRMLIGPLADNLLSFYGLHSQTLLARLGLRFNEFAGAGSRRCFLVPNSIASAELSSNYRVYGSCPLGPPMIRQLTNLGAQSCTASFSGCAGSPR